MTRKMVCKVPTGEVFLKIMEKTLFYLPSKEVAFPQTPIKEVIMKKIICLCIMSIVFVGEVSAAKLPPIQAYCENYPPYNFEKEGKVTGFAVKLLHAIAKQAGADITIKLGPWKRYYEKVKKTPNTIIFTATRNEGREDMFKWVGPISGRTVKLYKLVKPTKDWKMNIDRSSSEAALRSIKEGQYTIGAASGDASDKNLKAQGYKVFSSPQPEINIRQLLMGRFPIHVNLDLTIAMRLKQEGRSFSEVEEIAVFNDQYSYYYIVNKDTDSDVVYRLQKALDILKYNGVYKKIRKDWLK
jgi:polar amino acid transport system substrate-binding protein